jgi:hypothetical protein
VLEIGCPFGRAVVYWCMDATYSFAVVQRIYTFFSAGIQIILGSRNHSTKTFL